MTDTLQLDAEIKEVQAKFEALGGEIASRKEKINELNREVSGFLEEQVRLQGEFRLLAKLKDKDKPSAPEADSV